MQPGAASLDPGTLAFTEETSAWGLDGVEGVRLSAIDYDGDGWTDLFVRRGSGADDFGATRSIWLMRNRGDGTFEDVTEASGIVARRSGDPGGRPVDVHGFGDVDNDGDLDVYLGVSTVHSMATGGERSEIMVQNPDHTFTYFDELSDVRLNGFTDTVAGASFVDFDLDGDLDLWTPHHGNANSMGGFSFRPPHFYVNEGGAFFVDRTADLGLATQGWNNLDNINGARSHPRAWSANACDLNGDGLPELLAASYGRAPNLLWRATGAAGAVTFENVALASGYAFDDDQVWQDDQLARGYCQANPMAEDCAGVPAPAIGCADNWDHDTGRQAFRLGGNSGATMCGDVDNDGDMDLLTSEIAHWWAGQGSDHAELMVNTGSADVIFERPGRESMGITIPHDDPSGWNEGIMTGAIFDFDGDGWQDL